MKVTFLLSDSATPQNHVRITQTIHKGSSSRNTTGDSRPIISKDDTDSKTVNNIVRGTTSKQIMLVAEKAVSRFLYRSPFSCIHNLTQPFFRSQKAFKASIQSQASCIAEGVPRKAMLNADFGL